MNGKPEYEKAIPWLLKAAEKGNTTAMMNLAFLYDPADTQYAWKGKDMVRVVLLFLFFNTFFFLPFFFLKK